MKFLQGFIFVTLTVLGIVGCSKRDDFQATPANLSGQVDTSLPKDAQQKQKAIVRFLNAMQEGVGDAGQMQLVAPGIQFTGDYAKFLEGAGRLARWEFSGAPQGNDVSVKLFFDKQTSGPIVPEQLESKTRIYRVSVAGNSVKISQVGA